MAKKNKTSFDKNLILNKVKYFTSRRFDFLLLIMVIVLIYQNINISELTQLNQKKDTQIEKLNSYATYITDSGVIKQYERESFNVYREKMNVANVLVEYLIQSSYLLTDSYKYSFFDSSKTLFKSYKPFQDFYINFILINSENATEEQKKEFEIVKKNWLQILRVFTMAVNKNELPQILEKKKDSIDVSLWNTKENRFTIVLTIPVYTKSKNIHDIIDEGISTALIKATGYYNLAEKTTLNPFGMKFTSLSLNHPMINNNRTK